jgi:hypothetical protein
MNDTRDQFVGGADNTVRVKDYWKGLGYEIGLKSIKLKFWQEMILLGLRSK